MKRKKNSDGIEWLEFELLSQFPEIVHGVFLRHGGVSRAPFHSLNISISPGDDKAAVMENRACICRVFNLPSYAYAKAVHGKRVAFVDSDQDPQGFCDGLITARKKLALLISHADCQAAIFYDPTHKTIANVHCGWRGNVQNIYKETVETMKAQIGTSPQDLIVCISPSLGPDASEFKNHQQEFPPSFCSYQFKPNFFNLWKLARDQLEECGVLPHHIEIASLCTFEQAEDFFSYRREKVTGRNGTLVAII